MRNYIDDDDDDDDNEDFVAVITTVARLVPEYSEQRFWKSDQKVSPEPDFRTKNTAPTQKRP